MATNSTSHNGGGDDDDQSYTMITDSHDLEALGAHCAICRLRDFLPFRCNYCKLTYCLDHRTTTAHDCSVAKKLERERREELALKQPELTHRQQLEHGTQCADVKCKTFIDSPLSTDVFCGKCRRRYCVKHRLPEDHDCARLTPLNPLAEQKKTAVLSSLKAWAQGKASSVAASNAALMARAKAKPSSAATRLVALNKLKTTAKGDAKLEPDKRVYMHVEAQAETTTSKLPRGEFFFSKDWSIGRMLDEAAKGLQVQNVNNRGGGEDEKLRVFHVEKGRLLEFSEKVGQTISNGETVVLLRGVGPAVPDLIDV